MKKNAKVNHSISSENKNGNNTNGFLPTSLKFITTCIRTASSGVRSAGASVAASLSGDALENKDQVLWASFDRIDIDSSSFKCVLLLGYSNGFQVLDVDDVTTVNELVSRRDDPVTFLQIQPLPVKSNGIEGFRSSHPLLLVVADESKNSGPIVTGRDGSVRNGYEDPQTRNLALAPTVVRFYSLRSHNYVHVLRFRSTVYMVRCSPQIVAVGLASQIYCFDALTLENKFSVLSYPVPQTGSQGISGVNIGYGSMDVGPRWLAYASNNPFSSNTGRLSPQNLTPPGVSPSTSPSSGKLVARYAMESSKHIAAGLINLGDKGYKTLSKYCQELKHDGSASPVSSSSSWKAGWAASHSAETDVAGMVVVKDFELRAVISQFRAHTSPISALCFDPSGTLLVTASVHGNNINVFRIIPSYTKNGSSGTQNYDWSSSHVHLYKLHRGMTSAVIQDICFSHYSQWVAIVSSKGTCHVFALAPFGGGNILEIQNSHVEGPTLCPAVSLPWWSVPSFSTNQFSSPPPPSVTLSVVSRIKISNFFHAATSSVGKPSIPSGALAAVFHRSVPYDSHAPHALEHILVYTPSGHMVQYKLLPSLGGEPAENASRIGGGSSVQTLEEELRVKVEAVKSWDVCRRIDWPEREESVSGFTLGGRETGNMTIDASDFEDNDVQHKALLKPLEKTHIYIANAEVQINSGRIPVWKNPKLSFFSVLQHEADGKNLTVNHSVGEIEIEKVPDHEVEIRRKYPLPVFDHLHGIYPNRSDGGLHEEAYSDSLSGSHGVQENSRQGLSKINPSIIQSVNQNNVGKGASSHFPLRTPNQSPLSGVNTSVSFRQPIVSVSPVKDGNYIESHSSSLTNGSLSGERMIANSGESTEEASNTSSNRSDLSMNAVDEGPIHGSPNFEQFFKEGYYDSAVSGETRESAEPVAEVDSKNSPCDREKSEEDGDDDDGMLGGVFAFSEEDTLVQISPVERLPY